MTLFDFLHFSRPYWLLAIPFILIIVLMHRPKTEQYNKLSKILDPKLLPYLEYKNDTNKTRRWFTIFSLALFWIGLAGISWTKAPTTMFENAQQTVFVVDQSLSMYATDIKPNRQTQLKQIIRDILEQTKEGDIALVAFAGEAFVISPFSQDKQTVTHFLLALEPVIMPLYGSSLKSGVEAALSLHHDTNAPLHLIVLTDDVKPEDSEYLTASLKGTNVQLDVIAIGTEKGGLVYMPDGQTLKQYGRNVIPQTPIKELQSLTESLDGSFYHGRLSSNDIASITNTKIDSSQTQEAENKSIHWVEQGHWFALPLLLWLALQFRRGALACLIVSILFISPTENLQASPLNWFMTPDQKAQNAVNEGNWQEAYQNFQRPDWKAASAYTLESYADTIQELETVKRNAAENYNLGNAYALSGDSQSAISAYEAALEQDPSLQVAKENLEYLRQQEQKKEQEQNQQDNNQKDNQEQDSQNSESNNKDSSSDPKKDDNKADKQDKEQTSEESSPQKQKENQTEQSQSEQEESLSKEKEQALNQWLRQIQDDPGLLLQRKLWHLHQERRNEYRSTQKDGQNPW